MKWIAKSALRGAVVWCGTLTVGTAMAMEVQHADAHYQDRTYHVELSIVLDAPVDRVQAVLRDYASYPQLDKSILEARVLQRIDETTLLLYTKLRGCSGLFCRTVNRVERVQEAPNVLTAIVIPEQSEVAAGFTQTTLEAVGTRTQVRYRSSVVPQFWVPGLIGRPLMLRTLRETSLDLFRHIEARAAR